MRTWLVSASALLCSTQAFALSNITIMADGNASLAVTKLARDYSRLNNVGVSTSSGDRASQATQILEGSSADILITPDAAWIDELQSQGLVDVYSKVAFARAQMALAGPEASMLAMKLSDSFAAAPLVHAMDSQPSLLVGNPEYVAEGKYAREALRGIGALDVLEPYTLYLKSTEEMIEQVTRHDAYGIMLYGDALLMEHARVIDVFPEKSHKPITYYAVVVAGDNMEEARKFIRYLTSSDARIAITGSGLVANVLLAQNPTGP